MIRQELYKLYQTLSLKQLNSQAKEKGESVFKKKKKKK